MSTRAVILVGVWAAIVVGAVQLFDGNVVHAAGALVVFGAGIFAARAIVVARARWRRLRDWPRPGEPEAFPAGPRRVLLLETGLAGPE